ncbi:trypsin-like peptidase domain-containing protein [Candidatus Bathyarchaeota archaeon]|nr:trypsin-like peptidase domain-containing protein [Candidatus Bathyarchaeota archaeon]
MDVANKTTTRIFPTTLMIVVIAACLIGGGLAGYSLNGLANASKIDDLQNRLLELQEQISSIQSPQNINYILEENTSLSLLYEQVKDSVVMIKGIVVTYTPFYTYYSRVQGSGFVYNYTGIIVVITNYHVVKDAVNITVTFLNGNVYPATVQGADPYADLAVLLAEAPQSEYKPLEIVSSSMLEVGDPVIAVGNPYGLTGSMTTGVVSALGRTITEDMTGNYPIANVIQTSAPINSGNSGGPLMNYQGQVVGITTAIYENSQGLGFAIPSSTILREIESLIKDGSYNQHPWLGASGIDMTYEIAKAMDVNVTYGWLIVQVTDNGAAANAGLKGGTSTVILLGEYVTIGGDIIIAINNKRIVGLDDLSTYLEEYTSPGQTIDVTIIRNYEVITKQVTLGARPNPLT